MEKYGDLLEWRSHPVRENWKKGVLVIFFLIFLSVSIFFSYGTFWFLLSVLLVGGSLSRFFTVTRYRLDVEGATVKKIFYTNHKGWRQFRSYYPDRNGVLLSPFPVPSRLENHRGLYLLFPRDGVRRNEIIKFIENQIMKSG